MKPKHVKVAFGLVTMALAILGAKGAMAAPTDPYFQSLMTDRFAFAQTNFGLDLSVVPQSGSMPSEAGSVSFPGAIYPRLTIGGYHYWGNADFYVSFPIGHKVPSSAGDIQFNPGIETGAKWMLTPLSRGRISPFIGAAWRASSIQIGDGPEVVRNEFPVMAGVAYPVFGNNVLELGVSTLLNRPEMPYPTSKTNFGELVLPRNYVWFGYRATYETTVMAKVNETNRPKAKNAWMLSVGPSSAFQLSRSPFNSEQRAYYSEDSGLTVFPEFGIGYYFDEPDAAINLNYRSISFSNKAYGESQTRGRQSIMLEAYKFLFDYYGFVPYIGATISLENYSVSDSVGNYSSTRQRLMPGLVVGWDIRPVRYPQFLLRTNLRIMPNAEVKFDQNRSFSFNQFEFNFIEFVLYPERF